MTRKIDPGIISQINNQKMNLIVNEKEEIFISPDSDKYKSFYKQITPKSVDELAEYLSLSKESAKVVQKGVRTFAMPSALLPAEHLISKDQMVRSHAMSTAQTALKSYIAGNNVETLAHWKPLMNAYLNATKCTLHIFMLSNVDVMNGAKLNISKSTHAFYANNVTIHGTGKIVCHGNVTFQLNSLKGM